MATQLVLYSTSHCHLCDLAHALIVNVAKINTLEIIEIADSDQLLAQYGLRIPVLLRADTKAELNWPFTEKDIIKFLD